MRGIERAGTLTSGVLLLSDVESARFGIRVGRLVYSVGTRPSVSQVLVALSSEPVDLAILRYDAAHTSLAADLSAKCPLSWQADTLLYFSKDLSGGDGDQTPTLMESRILGPGDVDLVDHLVRDIFAGYKNHYASNPYIEPSSIIDGYVEWAQTCLHGSQCGTILVSAERNVLALATVALDGPCADVELAGVMPAFRGRGVYQRLLDHVEAWSRERGAERLLISTQAGNAPPIRAWMRRSYRYEFALNTVHIMCSVGEPPAGRSQFLSPPTRRAVRSDTTSLATGGRT